MACGKNAVRCVLTGVPEVELLPDPLPRVPVRVGRHPKLDLRAVRERVDLHGIAAARVHPHGVERRAAGRVRLPLREARVGVRGAKVSGPERTLGRGGEEHEEQGK